MASTLVFLPVFIGLAGLAYDGGQMFNARREAHTIAAASARAGAADVREGAYRWNQRIRLKPSATTTAEQFATTTGADRAVATIVEFPDYVAPGAGGRGVLQDAETVVVKVQVEVDLFFLDFLMGTQTVEGSGRARASHPDEANW